MNVYKKQRLLLGLIDFLSDTNQNTRLHLTKLMFLITQEKTPRFSTYHFHPYTYGPFSYQMYSDIAYLEKKGLLSHNSSDAKKIPTLTTVGKKEAEISKSLIYFLKEYSKKFSNIDEIIDDIYRRYPSFTCKSERSYIPQKISLPENPGIFLIGYEGKDIDQFLFDLITNNIEILIDVRNNPRSMKYMFNKGRLQRSLSKVDIQYMHIPDLGIPKEMRTNLTNRADYEALFVKYREILPSKEEYVKKIISIGESKRIALMCFEKDVSLCHRGQLGNYIVNKGIPVKSL